MEQIALLFDNQVFLSAVFGWLVTQLIKTVIKLFKKRPHSFKEVIVNLLWTTGGMPSSHSAVVSALATSIGIELGLNNPVFILSFFYAFITVRDALGVRRAAGHQATTINQLIIELSRRFNIRIKPVKEIHGHKFAEVSVGIFLGIIIAIVFNL